MAKTPFLGGAYMARSVNLNAQTCINLYPTMVETSDGKDVGAFYRTPGLTLFATCGDGPVRSKHAANSVDYVVSGDKLYSVAANGDATERGTLLTSTGAAYMADNGFQLMITDGTYGYIFTYSTSAFAQITSADFIGGGPVGFIDGFFVTLRPGTTGQFQKSAAYDGLTWDATEFATAEGSPDGLVGLTVDHREVWLFGTVTTEVWYNAGGADFPLARISGAFLEHGCAAAGSIAKMDNSVFWLGRDALGQGMVYKAQGYTPVRVTTHAIEEAINSYADISDAVAYCYQQSGHSFYVLTFPTGNATWVFDASTGLWHQRAYRDTETGSMGRHRSQGYAYAYGKHLVGDYASGQVYRLDSDAYTDNGDIIRWERAWAHIHSGMKRMRHNKLQIDLEPGTGLESGADPLIVLEWSNDGGHTWSNEHQISVSMGEVGEYAKRAIWRRLGTSRNRVYRVSGTDSVDVALIAAWLDAEVLLS